MANFFKDYRKQVKEKKKAEKIGNREAEKIEYEVGQVVYINPLYDWHNNNGKKYFVDYLDDDSILLADTKKEAMSGYGYIYSIYSVVKKGGKYHEV